MDAIATQLSVSFYTIQRDLVNLFEKNKLSVSFYTIQRDLGNLPETGKLKSRRGSQRCVGTVTSLRQERRRSLAAAQFRVVLDTRSDAQPGPAPAANIFSRNY